MGFKKYSKYEKQRVTERERLIKEIQQVIAGETAADENGTPIPGIRVVERDKAFTIEK